MADIWSYCSECERWYYRARDTTDRCPVCEAEPSATEDRATGARVARVHAPLASSAQA